jgi:hypothetical protein
MTFQPLQHRLEQASLHIGAGWLGPLPPQHVAGHAVDLLAGQEVTGVVHTEPGEEPLMPCPDRQDCLERMRLERHTGKMVIDLPDELLDQQRGAAAIAGKDGEVFHVYRRPLGARECRGLEAVTQQVAHQRVVVEQSEAETDAFGGGLLEVLAQLIDAVAELRPMQPRLNARDGGRIVGAQLAKVEHL